jgi:hypothetical protein
VAGAHATLRPVHLPGGQRPRHTRTTRPPPRACPQSCAQPARDLFGRTPGVTASLLVIPIIGDHGKSEQGAIYFAMDTPSDFAHLRNTLLVGVPLPLTPLDWC